VKYGYARVSTCRQAKNGNSLQDQERMLIRAGVSLENIFADSYTGTKMDRPEFDALLEIIKSGDELVVCKLDRFARTAPEGAMLVRDLVNRDVKVNILNMGIADNTPMGKVMVTVLLAFAEFERDMIVERTSAGKAYAREHKEGYREGRPVGEYPNFKKFFKMQKDGSITVEAACKQMGISKSQWYNLSRKIDRRPRSKGSGDLNENTPEAC
jgi:DNA invertase Pin-like site-specific DNA recombinase